MYGLPDLGYGPTHPAVMLSPRIAPQIIGGKEAPGRQRIQKAIDSLPQQSKDLVAAANAIGITKLTLVQP